ncbi:hypothetical protein AB1Y20_010342 [Prymnesium parvum]|uniref:Mediator of RNA polymerase II transcription subunit 28 n=1 Tax=Prymnesium parvum TaxID=97485 RepID=A0AB34K758_PRYPA
MAAAALAEEMRRELGACLRYAHAEEASAEGVDAHVRAFLAAARELHAAFGAAAAGGGEAARLAAQVAALRAELRQKDELLQAHRARLHRWQEQSAALKLSDPMLLPNAAAPPPP